VISQYRKWLRGKFDFELKPTTRPGIYDDNRIKAAAGVLALVVGGGTERLIQRVVGFGQPTLILAHESMNSLPAALEALSSMEERRQPPLITSRTKTELREVRCFTQAVKAFARIRTRRLGLIGDSSPWLAYRLQDSKELARRLGIQLINLPMDELKAAYESASESDVAKVAAEARSKDRSPKQMALEDFRKSSRIYLAIRKLAENHGLTSVSVKCFDFIADYKATGCYAIARLNNENFVAGCEGDVPATTAMIVLSEVSGTPSFMANPCLVKGHIVVLAHCTIAPRVTSKYKYRTHFESGLGIAIAGSLKKGKRVTLVRFSRTLDKLRAGEGVVVNGDARSENLCRTQVKIRMKGDAEVIKNRPLGNHYVLTYGEHVATLKSLASFAGIGFEEI
jgi:L-fucose isomerase-like protein